MKYEWKKQEKNLYNSKQTPVVVEVPKQKFISIKGQGNPNEEDFRIEYPHYILLLTQLKCCLKIQ